MSSQYWDEARAEAYRRFRFHFPEKTLAGKVVVVAGGTGASAPLPSRCWQPKAPSSSLATGEMTNAQTAFPPQWKKNLARI
jgi:hypothetical protein